MPTHSPGLTPSEVFDTNFDYTEGRRLRENQDGLRLVGRFARLFAEDGAAAKAQEKFDAVVGWWKSTATFVKAMHRQDKALRKEHGSLDIVSDQFVEQNEPIAPPHSVLDGSGLYRSNFSKEPPIADAPELSPDEEHDIMQAAVERARKTLGELPVMQAHEPELPRRVRGEGLKSDRVIGDPTIKHDESLFVPLQEQQPGETATPAVPAPRRSQENIPVEVVPGVLEGEVVGLQPIKNHRRQPRGRGYQGGHRRSPVRQDTNA